MLLKLHGKALKILFKQLEDKATFQSADQTISSVIFRHNKILDILGLLYIFFPIQVLKQMNLKYAQKFFETSLIMKYPKQYATFQIN